MKRLKILLVFLLFAALVRAQTPQKMTYQTVIRNNSSALVTNTLVGIRISILHNSSGGTVVYTETQTPTTNSNGLLSIEIGGGTGFNTINWADGTYFLKTEIDPNGSTNYTITGVSQMLSVPYSFYSKESGSVPSVQTLLYLSSGF